MTGDKVKTEKIALKDKFLNKKTFISFLLAFVIICFLIRQIDFRETIKILRHTRWEIYILAIFINYLAYPFRGLRWQRLLKNTGFREKCLPLTEILILSWFVNCIVPAKLGDLYRGYLLKKNYDISMSKAVGTVFVERISDILVICVLLICSGLIVFKGKIPPALYPVLVSGGILISIIFVIVLLMKKIGYKIIKIFPRKIQAIYALFEEGTFKSAKGLPFIFLLTVIIWFFESGRLFLVMKALNINIGIFLAVFIALIAAILTAFPFTPAGLGAVEAGITGILIFFGTTKTEAVSVALLDRIACYWILVAGGFIVYMVSKKARV